MNEYFQYLIDNQLLNRLTDSERIQFNNLINSDMEFNKMYEFTARMNNYIKVNGEKVEIKKGFRKVAIKKGLLKGGIISMALAGSIAIVFALAGKKSTVELNNLFTTIESQVFIIDNSRDTIIQTQEGMVFAIEAGTFKTDKKEVTVKIKEAFGVLGDFLSAAEHDSLKSNIGKFEIHASVGKTEMEFNKEVSIAVPINTSAKGKLEVLGSKLTKKKNVRPQLKLTDLDGLDFYPTRYLPTIKDLGLDYTNKEFTDSLYYSFSGFGSYKYGNKDTVIEKETGELKKDVGEKYISLEIAMDTLYTSLDSYIPRRTLVRFKIDPALIRTIKSSAFAKTFIATKEFEKRIKYIHTLCGKEGEDYLNVFINNLSKPLYYSDSICMSIAMGAAKQEFRKYYLEKQPGVDLPNRLENKLINYVTKKREIFTKEAKKLAEKQQKQIERELNRIQKFNTKNYATDIKRRTQNFKEEFCINIESAAKQLDIELECSTVPPKKYEFINILPETHSIYDLCYHVAQSTSSRTSLTYVNPDGKTAEIIYNSVFVRVKDFAAYDNIKGYLIADSISNYEAMQIREEELFQKLNSLLQYKLVVIGIKDKEMHVAYLDRMKPGNHSVQLKRMSAIEIKELLNKGAENKQINWFNEIKRQNTETANYKFKKQLELEESAKRKIQQAIFPCFENYFNENLDKLD